MSNTVMSNTVMSNTATSNTHRRPWQPRPWHLAAFAALLAFALGSIVEAVRRTGDTAQTPAVTNEAVTNKDQPWTEREVLFTSADGTRIAGSLSLPAGPGPFPAVVAISGAGVQDRDGMARDPAEIRMWPDLLARAGVALLRTDDRGIGGSGGDSLTADFNDLADDAEAAIAFLGQQPEIASDRIGLIGSSMGAIITAIVAGKDRAADEDRVAGEDRPAFIILKSSPGRPGREILFQQMTDLARAEGLPEATIQAILDIIREALSELMGEARREILRPLVEEQRRLQRTDPFFGPQSTAASIEGELDVLLSPGFRATLNHDPAKDLVRVYCPVLVLHGELDLQVDPKLNLPAIEAALASAPTRDVTVALFPRLNHLLQETETGKMSEYGQARFSPEPPRRAAAWIAERFVAP